MASRLGNVAAQPRGAARYASPTARPPAKAEEEHGSDIITLERSIARPRKEKQPMTIRLTAAAIERLGELERDLRRGGMRARKASASEIVEALVKHASSESLRNLMEARRA